MSSRNLPEHKIKNSEIGPRDRIVFSGHRLDEGVLGQRVIVTGEGHDAQQVPERVAVARIHGDRFTNAGFTFT